MSVRIKNCGLNTPDSVEAAIRSGADYLGFMQYEPSPRHVTTQQAAALSQSKPSQVQSVAVLVNPTDAELATLLHDWRPDMLQLHGDEPPQRVAAIRSHTGLPVIKAVAVATAADIAAAKPYQTIADMLLFDTKHDGLRGGSGLSFDWDLLTDIQLAMPWFLSGGLDATNVVEAIAHTHAPMVDVSSGIESARGVKDPAKIIAFNQQVRRIP